MQDIPSIVSKISAMIFSFSGIILDMSVGRTLYPDFRKIAAD
jgi:hypothetical protein